MKAESFQRNESDHCVLEIVQCQELQKCNIFSHLCSQLCFMQAKCTQVNVHQKPKESWNYGISNTAIFFYRIYDMCVEKNGSTTSTSNQHTKDKS
jgi:hypothetical protein